MLITQVYIQSVEERLTTLQLSLELLADICLQDDTEGKIVRIDYIIRLSKGKNQGFLFFF